MSVGLDGEGDKFTGETEVSSWCAVNLHLVLKVSRQMNDMIKSLLAESNRSW